MFVNNKYVIINGSAGCGKDEFVKKCMIYKENVVNMSTIDFVKTIALKCGWDGKKDDKGRKLLSDIKDALTAYDDIPIKHILSDVKKYNGNIIFIHCREPQEIKKLKNVLCAKTLLITNKNVREIKTNHADKNVSAYKYDYTVDNSGTLGDLIIEADKFLRWLGV